MHTCSSPVPIQWYKLSATGYPRPLCLEAPSSHPQALNHDGGNIKFEFATATVPRPNCTNYSDGMTTALYVRT